MDKPLDQEGMYLVHETKRIEQIKDYAYPCMMAEKALKEVHCHMLSNQNDKAIEECVKAITAISNLMEAIKK
jgi:hypothetical protein